MRWQTNPSEKEAARKSTTMSEAFEPWGPRWGCIALASLLVFAPASAAQANTPPYAPTATIRLSYNAPKQCPSRQIFTDAVRSRLGRSPFGATGLPVSVDVARQAGRFVGTLVVANDVSTLERRRRIDDARCRPVVVALAMALAVLLDRAPAKAVTFAPVDQHLDQERPARQRRPARQLILLPHVGMRASLGRVPGLALGPSLGVALRFARLRLAIRGQADIAVSGLGSRDLDQAALISGALDGCLRVAPFDFCLSGAAGGLHARPRTGTVGARFVGLVGLGLGLSGSVAGFRLRGVFGVDFTLVRATIHVDNRSVWVAPLVNGFLGLEIAWPLSLTDSAPSSQQIDEQR